MATQIPFVERVIGTVKNGPAAIAAKVLGTEVSLEDMIQGDHHDRVAKQAEYEREKLERQQQRVVARGGDPNRLPDEAPQPGTSAKSMAKIVATGVTGVGIGG